MSRLKPGPISKARATAKSNGKKQRQEQRQKADPCGMTNKKDNGKSNGRRVGRITSHPCRDEALRHGWGTCEISGGCCPSGLILEKLFVTSK
jgi:hypothetical protein